MSIQLRKVLFALFFIKATAMFPPFANVKLIVRIVAILTKAAEYGCGTGLHRPLREATHFEAEAGKGVKCSVDNVTVHIGNRRCLTTNDISITPGTFEAMEHLEGMGQTAVVVSLNGCSILVLGIFDQAKDEAALTVNVLQHVYGIKVHMLTGDNKRTAQSVALAVGILTTNVMADVLPAEKVDYIRRLRLQGEHVAMVGDGINDSPAVGDQVHIFLSSLSMF